MGAKNTTPVIDISKRRNSYDDGRTGEQNRVNKFRRDSTMSYPPAIGHKGPSNVTKSRAFYPGGPKTKKPNFRSRDRNNRNLGYPSDFDSDEEDMRGYPNDAMLRMKYLKKKRDTMKELEKRLSERDIERAREQRIRKYKELEMRHSGNSLQITRPDNARSQIQYNRKSPRPSPRPSPSRQKLSSLPVPKKKAQDRSLSQNASPIPYYRSSSLEKLEGSLSKLPFSSQQQGPGIKETEIPTACYKNPKVLNTIHNKNFKPLNNPQQIYNDNMELLKSDDWEEQVEGIQTAARLGTFHPNVILRDLKEMNALLMKHAKNLRSQVCRTAIQAITQFVLSLKKNMEQDLEKLVALLLNKTSDTNKFLREDSNCALDAMVEILTPPKVIGAIIHQGLGHKNPQVRANVGRLLAYSVERMGAARALSQKDVAEKVLPATAKLAQEGSLETRQMAKLTFQRLSTQPQFDSAMKKYVSSEDLKQIQKFLDNMNNTKRGVKDKARTRAAKGGARLRQTM